MLRSLLMCTLDSEPWKPTPRDSHYIRQCSSQGRPAAGAQRRSVGVVLKPRTAGPVGIWDGERKRAPIDHDSVHDQPRCGEGSGVRRQRGVDRPCAVTRSASPGVRAMGAVALSGREASDAIETFTTFLDRNAKTPSTDRHRKSRSFDPLKSKNSQYFTAPIGVGTSCRFTDLI